MLSKFILFFVLSAGFHWFIEYSEFFRRMIEKIDHPLAKKLLTCIYCQTIECSTIVAIALYLGDFWGGSELIIVPFAILTNGYLNLIWYGFATDRIIKTLAFILFSDDVDK